MNFRLLSAALFCLIAFGCTTVETPTNPTTPAADSGNRLSVTFSCTWFGGMNIQCIGDSNAPEEVNVWSYTLFRGEQLIRGKTGQVVVFSTSDQPEPCGTWVVRLEVSLVQGSTASIPDPLPPVGITIPPSECEAPVPPPKAAIGFDTDGKEVAFQDLSTNADTRLWLFGDGGSSTATNPVHVYDNGGNYNVQLDVAGRGGEDSTSVVVSILAEPVAGFTFTTVGLIAFFTDTSDGEIDRYEWVFGDGNTSNQQNPQHQYDLFGTYQVVLKVINDSGSSTFSATVTVP